MHREFFFYNISIFGKNFLKCEREVSIDRERDFPSCRERSDLRLECDTRGCAEIKIRRFEERKEEISCEKEKSNLSGEKFWVI